MPAETMDSELWKSDKLSEENDIAERTLFSSSLSDLFSRKLRLSEDNALHAHSVDAIASCYEEERLYESLEELKARIIVSLLPDEDDLLSGVTDDLVIPDSTRDEVDELELFTSGGGFELEDNGNSSSREKNSEIIGGDRDNNSTVGENPSGEHVSRRLFVRNIDGDVEDSVLKALFKQFGDIQTFDRACKHQGNAMITYYDVRDSQNAMRALQNRLFGRRKFDIHYSIPKIHPEFKQKECNLCLHQKSSPVNPTTGMQHGISSSVPNTSPSLIIHKSVGNQCEISESSSSGQLNLDTHPELDFQTHSFPEHHRNGVRHSPLDVPANANPQVNSNRPFMDFEAHVSNSSGKWSNSYHPPRAMWQNAPSFFNGVCAAPTIQRMNQIPMSPSHMLTTVLPTNNHLVQSPPLWHQRYSYPAESITPHRVDFVPHNMVPHFALNFHNQRGMVFPERNHMTNSVDTTYKRVRSRRNVGTSNSADLKRYELDIDCIKRGEDNRTTLMIKNIPNKYTSKMLMAAIDAHHKGTYDFLYLPIDFRNRCNVGYAFINMTDPSFIVPFYKVFNEKKWEKFNSEKVASLAYARIQGRAALIAHFENSSLMNEDKRCRPILINTDGPNAGDQVPFPIGINAGNKNGRDRSNTHEANTPNLENLQTSSDKDSISKESD
ncbi:protein MEI2-like 4 [Vicia villosa]|uniref:protein MEI2-like 4 n=1 Tax=Vicia villosa TaxID=3911 RepID=UPI00273ABF8B|nr:protein MEI2-like 4 [Vicia villosa]